MVIVKGILPDINGANLACYNGNLAERRRSCEGDVLDWLSERNILPNVCNTIDFCYNVVLKFLNVIGKNEFF